MEPLAAGDPRQVGPYLLHARLGSGGMGRVFLGFSPTGRAVAVKVIHPELAADPQFRVRFRREVAAARAVSSVYTAEVVAAEPDEEPPWLATVLVQGPSLAETVTAHGPLPAAAVWRLAAGLAEALQAIHSCGLVHRDLKPANVLLAVNGPLVIDFGISRALEGTTMTATGLVVGTPSFMSPEQAMGDPVTPASDVFSLGSLIVFAATGAGPFGDGQPAPVLYRVVHVEPALDAVPFGLRELAAACLIKHPGYRPALPALIHGIRADAPTHTSSLTSFWPDALTNLIRAHQASLRLPAEQVEHAAAFPDVTFRDAAPPDGTVSDAARASDTVRDLAGPDEAAGDAAGPYGGVWDAGGPSGTVRDAADPDGAASPAVSAGVAAEVGGAIGAPVMDVVVADGGPAEVDASAGDAGAPSDAGAPGDAGVPGDGGAPGDAGAPRDAVAAQDDGSAGAGEPQLEQVALEPAVPPFAASGLLAPGNAPGQGGLADGGAVPGQGGLAGAGGARELGGLATVDRRVPPAFALGGAGPTPAPAPPGGLAGSTVPPGQLPSRTAGPGGQQSRDPNRRRVLAGLAAAAAVGLGVAGWELSQGSAPRHHSSNAAGHNPARTRITHRPTPKQTTTAPPAGTQIWSTALSSTLFTTPDYSGLVVANGAAYITDSSSHLNALSAADGKLLWRIAVPNGGQGPPSVGIGQASPTDPVVAGSVVYVGGYYNDVMAVRATDGSTLWRKAVGGGVYTQLAVAQGNVYVVGYDAILWALNAGSGSTVWDFPVPGGQTSDPAAAGGAAYVVDNGQNLHALRAGSGSALWTAAVPGGPDSEPVPVGSVVYIVGADKRLHAIDAASGATRWAVAIHGGAATPPLPEGQVVYIGGGDGNLYALNAASGAALWQASIGGGPASETNTEALKALAPAAANGVVYVAGGDSNLHALSESDGTTLWSTAFGGGQGAASSPVAVGGLVYIASYDSSVYAFAT